MGTLGLSQSRRVPIMVIPLDRPVAADGIVQPYVTGFFDLLGFASRIREYDQIQPGDSYKEVTRRVTAPILALVRARAMFEQAVKTNVRERTDMSTVSPELREQGAGMMSTPFIVQQFSDSLVLSCPFDVQDRSRGALAVFNLFIVAANLMAGCLAAGVPIRGAIEIGYGTVIAWRGAQELVGSSGMKAYELERTAGWPRILIGKELFDDLWTQRAQDPRRHAAASQDAGFAKHCLRVVLDEKEGTHSLDWLHHAFGSSRVSDWSSITGLVSATCDSQIQEASRRVDAKVEGRWKRVKDYVEEGVRKLAAHTRSLEESTERS